jgi:anthranilate phosphoribosyltransferase
MIRTILPKLLEKQDLTSIEVEDCFREMMSGAATDAQIGAFLIGLRSKGETRGEIEAAVRVVREMAEKLKTNTASWVDTCGTGGDYSSSFNISTAAALIAAGAGAQVAKHGNRSASSQAGSADVVEALGISLENSPETVEHSIKNHGFGFMFAPLYHPAMKFVAGPRRELGVRSIFNMIGPLVNPAKVRRQLVGVWSPDLLDLFGEVLLNLGAVKALVVCGEDGLDEITLTNTTEVCELSEGRLRRYLLDPKDFGLSYCGKSDLQGGDAKVNAQIIEQILKGEDSPRRDVAALNAAAVIYIAQLTTDLKTAFQMANEAIDSGRANRVLEQLRHIRHS